MKPHFSIWIKPEGEVFQVLEQVIDELADRYGGPKFDPHMTLTSGYFKSQEKIIAKTKKLAAELAPFPLFLGEVEFSSTYFQNVFVRVKTTAPVLEAHLLARKFWQQTSKHVFMPHISLLYGDQDMKTREQIIKQIKLPELKFTAKKLTLIRSEDEDKVEDWRQVAEFEIKF